MWKKLFYDASKMVANDVSRAYAKDKKKQMLQNKEQRLVEDYRRNIIVEYQQDFEKQQDVKAADSRLEFLIATNKLCNQCLEVLLAAPFENLDVINIILDDFQELKLKTLEIFEMDEYESEYFSQMINNTVEPFTTLSTIMFGDDDEEDSSGIIMLLIEFIKTDNQNFEELFELLHNTIELIHSIQSNIREVFIETKKIQIVSYIAYDETGEVDFGNYTINDLD